MALRGMSHFDQYLKGAGLGPKMEWRLVPVLPPAHPSGPGSFARYVGIETTLFGCTGQIARANTVNGEEGKFMNIDLEKIKKAVEENPGAKPALRKLFPEAFADEPYVPIAYAPGGGFVVGGITGHVQIRNSGNPKINNRGIYLDTGKFTWQLINDAGSTVLVASEK